MSLAEYVDAPPRTAKGRTWEEIHSLMTARRQADGVLMRQMLEFQAHYNGDIVIPVHDVQGHKTTPAMTARLATEAIDSLSRLSTSGKPSIMVPPLEAFKETGARSMERAARRRRVLYARWDQSALGDVILRRAYRHFYGYGTCAFVVMPDFERGGAMIELRNPLGAYPELRSLDDVREPLNVGFVVGRSFDWIRKHYPTHATKLDSAKAPTQGLWDIVEWLDEEVTVLGVLGPRGLGEQWSYLRDGSIKGAELARWENRAGRVCASIPRRVGLDRLMGMTDSSLAGLVELERMNSLNMIAAEKSVFADMVIVGQDGREAKLVSGRWHDGRTGIPNELVDGDVKLLQSNPGPLTLQNIDRAERNFRVSTGLIPQSGGETYGGLRTGRAIDAIGGFSVEPRVQEGQEIVARSLATVNRAICWTEQGYCEGKKYTVFSGWPGEVGQTEYEVDRDWESDANVVTYSFPGTEISQISVAIGQLLGGGVMSRRTGRTLHPLIQDAEGEERAVMLEHMSDAAMGGFMQQVSTGALPLIDQARIMRLYAGGMEIWDAIEQASREAQERQAAAAPPPQDPGMAASPETMPGLAMPGQGVESQPTIAPPSESQVNFRDLTRALRTGVNTRT